MDFVKKAMGKSGENQNESSGIQGNQSTHGTAPAAPQQGGQQDDYVDKGKQFNFRSSQRVPSYHQGMSTKADILCVQLSPWAPSRAATTSIATARRRSRIRAVACMRRPQGKHIQIPSL